MHHFDVRFEIVLGDTLGQGGGLHGQYSTTRSGLSGVYRVVIMVLLYIHKKSYCSTGVISRCYSRARPAFL